MSLSKKSVDMLAMEADIVFGAVKPLLNKGFSIQGEYNQIKGIMNEMQSRIKRYSVDGIVNGITKGSDYSPEVISKRLEEYDTFNSFKTMINAIRFYRGLLQQGH